jgi:hypothetical protein
VHAHARAHDRSGCIKTGATDEFGNLEIWNCGNLKIQVEMTDCPDELARRGGVDDVESRAEVDVAFT